MKKIILILLGAIAFAACQKNGTNSPKPVTASKDTIPDEAYFKVQIVKDSIQYYEILIHFNHTFHLNYTSVTAANIAEDEKVISLPAKLNLSAITSDGTLVNWDGVPYTQGMSIPLDANAYTGVYFLKTVNLTNIPSSAHIWVKDNLLKDSLDLRTGNYHFNIDQADTNSFGKRRFQIVVR